MITQDTIEAAFWRASYGDLVDPGRPVAWFGAGLFARRLAPALGPDARAHVGVILDDNAPAEGSSIEGISVRRPDPDSPPAQIVLATDTHAIRFRDRIRALWGAGPGVLDLSAPPIGAWTDPGDEAGGFARTHPERWRESLGLAQLEMERRGEVASDRRWMLAHTHQCKSERRFHFRTEDHERFIDERAALAPGQVITISGDRPIRPDPFWLGVINDNHSAISPDGLGAAIVWAGRDVFPVCPMRTGNALWIPHEPTNIVRALYDADAPDGVGAKRYTVRFDRGAEFNITATRERTYADIRGSSELARYERFALMLPAGARVLDCATGTGPGAEMLASLGFDVVGVDVDAGAIAFAGDRYPQAEFVCASAADLPFPDDHFDAVVSIETIEHLPDPGAALGEFARVCKPDGVVCLTTPDEGACDSPYHEIELTTDDLHRALDRAFGQGGWMGEPVAGAGAWHAMLIRRRQTAHL